jgi:hypothetical protein
MSDCEEGASLWEQPVRQQKLKITAKETKNELRIKYSLNNPASAVALAGLMRSFNL